MTLILDKENPLATKVQTRDGKKARLICVDRFNASCAPLVALVRSSCVEVVMQYLASGRECEGMDQDWDLINAPVTHKRWVNMYRYADGPISGAVFETRFEADLHNSGLVERIACKEIEFKEGDGL